MSECKRVLILQISNKKDNRRHCIGLLNRLVSEHVWRRFMKASPDIEAARKYGRTQASLVSDVLTVGCL